MPNRVHLITQVQISHHGLDQLILIAGAAHNGKINLPLSLYESTGWFRSQGGRTFCTVARQYTGPDRRGPRSYEILEGFLGNGLVFSPRGRGT